MSGPWRAMSRLLLLSVAILSCGQSGESATTDEPAASPRSDVEMAAVALESGRPWRANGILEPLLADPRRRTPEAILLAARAAAELGGWSDVDRLLRNQPWLDSAFAGRGRALLARAAFERRDDGAAVRNARLALRSETDAADRGARLVLLARALERLGQRDSARVAYEAAAAELPDAADWVRLRVAALTIDTIARANIYGGLSNRAAANRAPWVEAAARERAGDLLGASARYEALGARTAALRLRLLGTRDAAVRAETRRQLFATMGSRPESREAREAAEVVTQVFSLTPNEELTLARSIAGTGSAARAASSFARAFAAGLGTTEDRFTYGTVLARLGRHADAAQQFHRVQSGPLAGDAAYQRARALLRTTRGDLAAAILDRVVRSYPSSVEAASSALYLLGDLATDRGEDAHARALFRRVAHRYPTSSVAAAARFRAALIAFVSGDHRVAALELDTLMAKHPESSDVLAATYWSGRAWAAVGDTAAAASRWRMVRRREPLSYYALLSARRLAVDFATLPEPTAHPAPLPEAERAIARGRALERLGLDQEARYEYDHVASGAESSATRLVATAVTFGAHGLHARGTQLARRALTLGGASDAVTFRALYPLAFADLVRTEAESRRVDPALVAALIRQESGFEPRAVSRVGAAGLMQIMPEVGRTLAASSGFTSWRDPLLRQPEINVRLGTQHLANLLRQYSHEAYALAAYNAGSGRVARWMRKRGTDDPEVFVERIPFTETRDYVRIVQRNKALYQSLYVDAAASADGR